MNSTFGLGAACAEVRAISAAAISIKTEKIRVRFVMFRRVRETWTLGSVSFVGISDYDGGVVTYPTLGSPIQKVQVLRRYIIT